MGTEKRGLSTAGGGESELGTTLQEGNLAVYTEVLEMCVRRAGDSVSENFSKGNRYVAGASRIFFSQQSCSLQ